MKPGNIASVLQRLGIPFGREDSVKLLHGKLFTDRCLIGVDVARMDVKTLFKIASDLGMPPAGRDLLLPRLPHSNAVFFGIEPYPGGFIYKIYLEFWDAVCAQVRRTGARAPLLLHFGVKWDSNNPEHCEEASYTCFPLLHSDEILKRMADLYALLPQPHAYSWVQDVVTAAHHKTPSANFLYLEASEKGNFRKSFDINLYKTGILLEDTRKNMHLLQGHFDVPEEAFGAFLHQHRDCALGHLSGGTDRQGNEFLSIYVESMQ